jgi:hypothetical protein
VTKASSVVTVAVAVAGVIALNFTNGNTAGSSARQSVTEIISLTFANLATPKAIAMLEFMFNKLFVSLKTCSLTLWELFYFLNLPLWL